MKNKCVCRNMVVVVVAMFASTATGQTMYPWIGGTSGTQTWEDAGNWSGGNPWTGYSGATINDVLTGDRDIRIGGNAWAYGVDWTESGSGFVNKITLDTDFNNLEQGSPPLTMINSSGDASKMVIDLNGYKWRLPGAGRIDLMTWTGPGTIELNSGLEFVGGVQPVFGAGVEVVGTGNFRLNGGTMPAYTMTGGSTYAYQAGTIAGDLQIDDGRFSCSDSGIDIDGDVTVATAGNTAGLADQGKVQSTYNLAGNLIDLNTVNDNGSGDFAVYKLGKLALAGGGPEQTLDVRRPVGMRLMTTEDSHVALGSDFDSDYSYVPSHESQFALRSTVDVGANTLTLGDLSCVLAGDSTDAQNFIFEAGSDSGRIDLVSSTGGLFGSVGVLNFEIRDAGGWNSGDDFILFDYSNGVSETLSWFQPSLGDLTLPTNWSSDGVVFDQTANLFYVDNLMVPEPVTLSLLLVGSVGLLRRRQR